MFRPRFLPAAGIIALAVLTLTLISRAPDEVVNGAAHAIDGDSIVIGERQMRLTGLDAPELRQTCEIDGKVVPCGRQSLVALRRWLARGPVTCVGNEVDRYQRLLVVCRIKGQDIGAELVRMGHAVDYGSYAAQESEAKHEGRGIWAGRFERPEAYRRHMREENARAPNPGNPKPESAHPARP